jgi:hypothetical protein
MPSPNSRNPDLTNGAIIQTLRSALRSGAPGGPVRLALHLNYFTPKFIKEAIDELERLIPMVQAGVEETTPLQRLGIYLLLDSAGVERK